MNDVIEQEVRIEAPIEQVRQVITDPAYVLR
jgi:carbon monoxide dehydrogenase subunit G